MSAKRGIHPALREEDIARALNLCQHREALRNVLLRRCFAQRMVQVAQSFEHPRLALAEGGLLEAIEEAVTHGLVG